jgi:hypothetical protein
MDRRLQRLIPILTPMMGGADPVDFTFSVQTEMRISPEGTTVRLVLKRKDCPDIVPLSFHTFLQVRDPTGFLVREISRLAHSIVELDVESVIES